MALVGYSKSGVALHEGPMTEAEEMEFYRRTAAGPVTVVRGSKPHPAAEEPQHRPGTPPQEPEVSPRL